MRHRLRQGPLAAFFHWHGLECFGQALLVAGGMGVAPMKYLTRELRKRGSQVGAWASNQSAVLPDREAVKVSTRCRGGPFACEPRRGHRHSSHGQHPR